MEFCHIYELRKCVITVPVLHEISISCCWVFFDLIVIVCVWLLLFQLLRSAGEWSCGVQHESSILRAYCASIRNAQHFIYIEVSSSETHVMLMSHISLLVVTQQESIIFLLSVTFMGGQQRSWRSWSRV